MNFLINQDGNELHDMNHYENENQRCSVVPTSKTSKIRSQVDSSFKLITLKKNTERLFKYLEEENREPNVKPQPNQNLSLRRTRYNYTFPNYQQNSSIRKLSIPKNDSGLTSIINVIAESKKTNNNLNSIHEVVHRTYDCAPFFHAYNYENRLGKDDYTGILKNIIDDEFKECYPVFPRELEFRRVEKKLRRIDYFLYYFLNIDRTKFFELEEERSLFYNSSITAHTSSLAYMDTEEQQNEDDILDNDDTLSSISSMLNTENANNHGRNVSGNNLSV
ncbi:Isc10p NDAI_0B02360 [Naumovozyma dairenensis CBS 421]|uniref:Uncharacterized protein n=1 Tax=Naumovozyma dairenensis (strain ATCC 10597 / BCRC 20456 / CBS 421 / NBRC 0211 / NRRL Y-12639) TaxID=1071378 RepID=G0W660_NAUDC|nr:hypothetical protein NDAI_0B02360 [Naumovozyma dairenensis CBS 421]CCD23271.1 hypothetical protein NDAI_0B02360 [Naumovozyma dairenensis CBS 421]